MSRLWSSVVHIVDARVNCLVGRLTTMFMSCCQLVCSLVSSLYVHGFAALSA